MGELPPQQLLRCTSRGYPTGGNGVDQGAGVPEVVRRVLGGESGDRVVERSPATEGTGEGGGVAGPGAERAVVGELAEVRAGEVTLALHVPEPPSPAGRSGRRVRAGASNR